MCRDNGERYIKERAERWGMAEKGEPEAIDEIKKQIIKLTNGATVNVTRYDELWFGQYSPKDKYDWLRGAPDYCIEIIKDNQTVNLYVEIKIKDKKFRKTKTGGLTCKNSINVEKYGCESYYLDIVPVHRNMNLFCQRLGIDKKDFVIAFVNTYYSEIDFISLAKVNELIENGWNSKNISKYTEGYNERCYLIPEYATSSLKNTNENTKCNVLTSDKLIKRTTKNMIIPNFNIEEKITKIDWINNFYGRTNETINDKILSELADDLSKYGYKLRCRKRMGKKTFILCHNTDMYKVRVLSRDIICISLVEEKDNEKFLPIEDDERFLNFNEYIKFLEEAKTK